jgi:arginyl-tRNA synthetase
MSTYDTIQGLNAAVMSRLSDAITRLGAAEVPDLPISRCPTPEQGDLALPCFALRGALSALDPGARNNPVAIAKALAAAIPSDALIQRAAAAGPYLNLKIDTQALIRAVLSDVAASGSRFGMGQPAHPERVVVEFSSPNTNKPQHLGHVRNNLLGESVSRCIAHSGHHVTKVNLVNDRGIHICKSMLAYQRWGEGITPQAAGKKGDHLIGDFYVLFETKFQAEYAAWQQTDAAQALLRAWLETDEGRRAAVAYDRAEQAKAKAPAPDPSKPPKKEKVIPAPAKAFFSDYQDTFFNSVSDLGRACTQLLLDWEADDPAVRTLWSTLNRWVLDGFLETYARLGVSFDKIDYESHTYKLGKEIVADGLQSGVFQTRADGAVTFDLTKLGLTGEKVLLRSNGTSVYMTQDLGTALARHDAYQFDKMIYVVGNEQEYHFKVLFGVLGHVRPALANSCHHLSYGMVHLPQGKMKSREGTVVDADNLMDEMRDLVLEEIQAKLTSEHYAHVDEAEQRRRAEVIALASIKYFLLDFTAASDVKFDPQQSIDFTGRTGAYCIYNYARTRSLLRKAGELPAFNPDTLASLGTDAERELVTAVMGWPAAAAWAARDRDPAKVCDYLFQLCKSFSFLFTDSAGHPIIRCEDASLRAARLMLVDAVGGVLKLGLTLLGIETLEEM